MARHALHSLLLLLTTLTSINAYWLMGIEDFITTERLDPIVNPGKVSGHVHSVLGGSNFRMNTNTADLRNSECTSIPIPEDKSNYWFPHLYFQWNNGSFTSLNGGAVIYYLFNDKPGTTTAFPDDFRMLSGDPTLRSYDPNSYAQQAVTFLCLDFDGTSTRYNSLPEKACPSGIRAQVNFPSCWDGKNLDSPDHKSHVAFLSGGPDSGTCSDPAFPVTLPRIFIEVYWDSHSFDNVRSQAKNPNQPFVYAYGDPTGYGYHADFINGWDKGVLQNAVDKCHCNIYGDPTCCVDQGIFHMNQGKTCRITKAIDEQTTGTLAKLPGNNPVQGAGGRATMFTDPNAPVLLEPIFAYTGDVPSPAQVGRPVPGSGSSASSAPSSPASSSKPSAPSPSPPASSSKPSAPSPSQPATSSVSNAPPPSSSSVAVTSRPVPTSSPITPSSSPTSSNSAPASPTPPVGGSPTHTEQSTPVSVPHSSSADDATPTPPPLPHTSSVAPSPSSPIDDSSPSPCPSSEATSHTSASGSSPTPNVPLPPSSGTGSNPPAQNPPVQDPPAQNPPAQNPPTQNPSHDSPPSPPVGASPTHLPNPPTNSGSGSGSYPAPAYPPSVTFIAGGGSGNGAPAAPESPAATTITFPGSVPLPGQMCSGGKFRHKLLKEKSRKKRSLRHARSFLENRRRFTKPHARAL